MSKRIKTLIFVAGGLAVVYAGISVGLMAWFVHRGPDLLVDHLGKKGVLVELGPVQSNYLNTVNIRDVEIRSPVRGHVDLLKARITPLGLLSVGKTPPHLLDVTLHDGSVQLSSGSRSVTIDQINGRFRSLWPTAWRGRAAGFSDILGDVHMESRGSIFTAKFEDADVKKAADLFGKPRIAAVLSGKAAGELTVDNSKAWTLQITPRSVFWTPTDSARPLPLNGHLTLSQTKIVHDLTINKAVRLKGILSNYAASPRIKSRLTIQQDSLAGILPILNVDPSGFPMEGSVDLEVTAEGPLDDLIVTGAHKLDLSRGPIKIPPITGATETTEKSLNIVSNFMGGTVALEGPIDTSFETPFSVRISGVRLNRLAQENGWRNVDAEVAGRFDLVLKKLTPVLDGAFSLKRLSWGRVANKDLIVGKVAYRKGSLKIETNDNSLIVDAKIDKQAAELNQFSLRFTSHTFLEADGGFHFADKSIGFRLRGQAFPPDTWPPLVARYPDITGSLNFEGTVTGPVSGPTTRVDILFHNLRFIPEGQVWNGTMDLTGGDKILSLKNINVDGGYRGEAVWFQKPGGGDLNLEFEMDNADPRLLSDILLSSEPVGGRLDGNLRAAINPETVSSFSDVKWTNGRWSDFQFDELKFETRTENREIRIEDIHLIRNNRAVRGSGRIQKIQDRWDYDIAGQLQQWGDARVSLDGELTMTGSYSQKRSAGSARVQAPILLVNGLPVENVDLTMTRKGSSWETKGTADPRTQFRLQFNSKTGAIAGHLDVDKAPLNLLTGRLLAPLGIDPISGGTASGNVVVRGTGSDPRGHIRLELDKAQWRNETFDSKFFIDINGSTMSIISSKTQFLSGGTVFATGDFRSGGEKPILVLEGVGSSLKLNTLFQLLRWPVRWEGSTDVSFYVSGPRDGREMKIAFEGSHDGIGPFAAGGVLTGAALLSNDEWDLTGVKVQSGNGFAQLTKGSRIFVDRTGAGHMRLVTDTRNLRAGVLTLFGRMELTGSWGPREEEIIEGERVREISVFARSLWINQFVLNGNVTNLVIRKGSLEFKPIRGGPQQISGVLNYENFPDIRVDEFYLLERGEEKVYLNGWVGAPKWDFAFRAQELNSDIVRGLFDTTVPMTGPIDIRINGKGNIKNPIIRGNIAWKNGRIGVFPLDLLTAHIELENGILHLTKLFVRKNDGYFIKGAVTLGTDLSDAGRAQKPEINLKIENGDFRLLESMSPDVLKSRGDFEGMISLSFHNDRPQLSGFLDADDLTLKSRLHIPLLKRGRVKIRFDEEKFEIEEARGKLDRGTLQLEGKILFEDGEPETYDLHAYTPSKHGVRIRVPELTIPPGVLFEKFSLLKKRLSGVSQGEAKLDLYLRGAGDAPRFEGKIDLENTVFTFPPQKKENQASSFFSRSTAEFFKKVEWDVVFSAGERTRYENKLVGARIDGSTHLSGPTDDLSVNGRIVTTQGSIVYSGSEFKINEAVLEVITQKPALEAGEPKKILIYLKAEAEKEVFYSDALGQSTQDTILMEVDRALLGEIQPRFRSKNNPGLSSQRALQLALGLPITESLESNEFLTGQSGPTKGTESDVMLRLGLIQLLDSNLASPLARAVARQTGLVDFIRVSYDESDDSVVTADDVSASQTGPQDVNENSLLRYMKGTKVQLGRELSSRLFADYSFKVDEFKNEVDLKHELELAYRLHRNLFLKASSELDTERTLGRPPDRRAILENRWRFGLPRKKKPATPPAEEPVQP